MAEPFLSTKRTADNMGLGLSIVRSTVEASKAIIAASNEETGGAKISIEYPI